MQKKLIIVNVIIIMLIFFINTYSYGFSTEDIKGTTITQTSREAIEGFGQDIINILTTAGSICSVIVLIILGIKYMMGSAEEKAEYKKTLLPYIIGAFLVFAASTLASIVYNIAINV